MSTPTPATALPMRAELLALSQAGEGFLPSSSEQTPQQRYQPTFLSLAPTTSASYPVPPPLKSSLPKQAAAPTASGVAFPALALQLETEDLQKTRRSSSLGSDGSIKKRFLKLGPVHFGEGDGKGDWSEEVIAE